MEETVKLFMEVTKEENKDVVNDILKTCNWNLEESIATYMELYDFSSVEINKEKKHYIYRRNKKMNDKKENDKDISEKNITKKVTHRNGKTKNRKKEEIVLKKTKNLEKKNFLYMLNPLSKFFSPIFKNLYSAISTVLKLFTTLISSTSCSDNFITNYENKYGKKHAKFFDGSFNEAIAKAKKEEKLLLVYLHLDGVEYSYLCENILNNEDVQSFLNENCILFAQDAKKSETKELKKILSIILLPQINVLTAYEKKITELTIIYGQPSVENVIQLISQCIEEVQTQKENKENLKHKTVKDRLIREEQDREYQEALKKDLIKEEERRKKENYKLEKIKSRNEIKMKRKQQSQDFDIIVDNNEKITNISLRFSNGKRIQRIFNLKHTLKDIYNWAEYSEFLEKDIIVPYKFHLICAHTKTILQKIEKEIGELDLYPSAVLNVKSLDTSDEE